MTGVEDLGTIVGVWAHPDDEAFLSAGIMAAARARSQRVFVVTADVPAELGTAEVAGVIDAIAPDTILTFGPDGYTGHPDHRAMSVWVDEAVRWTRSPARILHATTTARFPDSYADIHDTFDVFFAGWPSVTDPTDLALDVTLDPVLLGQKLAALAAHSSQTAGLIEGMGIDRFAGWVAGEHFVEAPVLSVIE